MYVLTPDMEVRVATVKKVVATTNPFYEYFDRFSDWNKLRLFVSWMLRYAEFLGNRNTVRRGFIGAPELRRAELAILRVVQKQHFSKEYDQLEKGLPIAQTVLYECCTLFFIVVSYALVDV